VAKKKVPLEREYYPLAAPAATVRVADLLP
jgi:hypothetical protein